MRHIVQIFLLLLLSSSLFASLKEKSAIVYYGKNISYSMVGIHDYIIVQPELVDTARHGFQLYKDKIYAYVSIGEIDSSIKEYKKVKPSWVVAKNKAWKSEVLDITNKEYQKFIFDVLIEPRRKEGFKNFFFDTLDSYQIAAKTKSARAKSRKALADFINEFHRRYPHSKLILNRGFEIIDSVHNSIEAVLFESYYKGIGGKNLAYKAVSAQDRAWLDIYINKIQSYHIPVISVEYLNPKDMKKEAKEIVKKIEARGMIPYISNRDLTLYGVSAKNAIKREVFTLIDESKLDKRLSSAHEYGAMILEYMGYIQKLYDIEKPLPSLDEMRHYAGVVIWLQRDCKDPQRLMKWLEMLRQAKIKVVFANSFAGIENTKLLKLFGLKFQRGIHQRTKIVHEDKMIGYEIEPSLSLSYLRIKVKNAKKKLLTYKLDNDKKSTLAAITPWGGYAIKDGYMVEIKDDNLWVINPFSFFKEALGLEPLLVPDVTTENGKRLLFTHVDGDGIMNRVEGIKGFKYSGEVIYQNILRRYKIPHSVSIIGAEVEKDGLYPKLSSKMTKIAKEFYSLSNVEPATHTFTHPFFWREIDSHGFLPAKYRLKVKHYKFSMRREIEGSLQRIDKLLPKGSKKANIIFWTGDCAPKKKALKFVYKHNILNMNGGDTTITKLDPWLTNISPLGIERGGFYQVYTGAQNENVFTNDWRGPFWGFKRVTQTFEMTNTPRRLKPIDIYYHLYSGSKKASMKALTYVFDWALKQDVMPIYTSAYIPKVMDFYEVSLAKEGKEWLVEGMKNLKTLRVEKSDAQLSLKSSPTVLGLKHFEGHTYISVDTQQKHYIKLSKKKPQESYLVSANAKVLKYKKNFKKKEFILRSEVPLKASFYLQKGCKLKTLPSANNVKESGNILSITYTKVKKVTVDIVCK